MTSALAATNEQLSAVNAQLSALQLAGQAGPATEANRTAASGALERGVQVVQDNGSIPFSS